MELPVDEKHSLTKVAVVVYSAMAVAALAMAWWLGINPWCVELARTAWQQHALAVAYGLAATLPLMGLLTLFERRPPWFLAKLKDSVDQQVMPLLRGLSVAEFAIISLCAGVGEELLFRGLAQTWLQQWLSDTFPVESVVLSVLIAGVFFGACHWINDQYALVAAVAGMYLGLVFVLTDHLLAPMVTHAAYDFFALWYLTSQHARPAGAGDAPAQSSLPED